MRLLVAVDLTEEDADDFVRRAVVWATPGADIVDLLFVDEAADQHPYVLDPGLRATMSTHYDTWHAEMRAKLQQLLQDVPEAVRGEAQVIRGRAAPTILAQFEDHDAVVLGNRPATGLSRLAHGVVAERVSRQSTIPVIILPRSP